MSVAFVTVVATIFLIPFWLRSRRGIFRNPKQAVPFIIKNFHTLTQKEFQPLEHSLSRRFPRSPELDLIYALRVSLPVRQVTSIKTLGSRWSCANFGAGGSGLQLASDSRNHRAAQTFLTRFYLEKFRELATHEMETAREKELHSRRSGATARVRKKITDSQYDFIPELPGLREEIDRFLKSP